MLSGRFDDQIVTQWEAVWDTTALYTTGEVTLLWAVPEASSIFLLLTALVGPGTYVYWRRKRTESAKARRRRRGCIHCWHALGR